MKEITLNNEGVKPAGEIQLIEPGSYDALIHGIVSLGLRPCTFEGKPQPPKTFFKVIFEIPSEKIGEGENERARTMAKKYRASNSLKSHWFPFVKAFADEPIDSKTILQFPLSKLLNKSCVLDVKYWEKDAETTIPYIDNISKLDPRLPQPQATKEPFLFSPNDPDLEVFENMLTYHTQNEIMQALDADQFPKELHQLWVKIQEEKEKEKKGTTTSVTNGTESIE